MVLLKLTDQEAEELVLALRWATGCILEKDQIERWYALIARLENGAVADN